MADLRTLIQASLDKAEQQRSPEAIARRHYEKRLVIVKDALASIARNIEIARHNIKLSGQMLSRDAVQNDIGAYWFWLESAFNADQILREARDTIDNFAAFYPELAHYCAALRARIEAE